jgi:hypothetical protein
VPNVVIGPGVSVNVRFFGEPPSAVDMSQTKVSLVPLENHVLAPPPSITQPSGATVVQNVLPAEYLLSVSGLPGDAYVLAARMQERDALERFVDVRYETAAPLDIQLAFDGGQLAGNVTDAAGQPAAAAAVVLVPDAARRHRPDQYRMVFTEQSGEFLIRGIPPGAYKAFAWERVEPNAYLNSDFLLDYEELGAPVSVGAGAKLSVPLRSIPGQE